MNTAQKYIYEIWKQKSFTKAAEKLYVSQPALSIMVKKEENRIGAALFDRSISPLQLTPAGELYFDYLEQICHAEELFEQKMAQLQGLKKGSIRIGASNLGLTCILPRILKRMLVEYPDIKIKLVESTSFHLQELLLAGELDFVIDTFSGQENGVCSVPFLENRILLAIPKCFQRSAAFSEYQLKSENLKKGIAESQVLPDELLREALELPFVLLKEENSIAQRALAFFRHYDVVPDVLFSLDQLETAIQYTAEGIGASFLMDVQVRYGILGEQIDLYALPDTFEQRDIGLAWKKGRELSPAMRVFLEKIEEWV